MHRSRGRRAQVTPAHRRTAEKPAEAAGQRAPSGSSVRRLMVTPTFVFSMTILTVAVLAFGTTQTYLRFSSSGPGSGCAAAGCVSPDASHAAGGKAPAGPMAAGAARRAGRPSPSPGGPVSGASARPGHPRTEVHISYHTVRTIPGGFVAEISIAGRGGPADSGWRLSVRYPGVRITWMAGATWHLSGGAVIIEPVDETPLLRKGATLPIMFVATGEPGAPSRCLFEGARCHIAG